MMLHVGRRSRFAARRRKRDLYRSVPPKIRVHKRGPIRRFFAPLFLGLLAIVAWLAVYFGFFLFLAGPPSLGTTTNRHTTHQVTVAQHHAATTAHSAWSYLFLALMVLPAIIWIARCLIGRHFVHVGWWGRIAAFVYGFSAIAFALSPTRGVFAAASLVADLGAGAAATAAIWWLGGREVFSRVPRRPKGTTFALWLGKSTGKLAKTGHEAALHRGGDVTLFLDDAARNIKIFGGTGSGKTSRAVRPLLFQLLDQRTGGLIFDIKGTFADEVRRMASEAGRQVVEIGVGAEPLNLTAGLTPETAATFLKSVFLLGGTPHDPIWVDSAVELCRNSLGVLLFLDKYSLANLHHFLFALTETERAEWMDAATIQAARSDDPQQQQRLIQSYTSYFTDIFATMEPKFQRSVLSQVSQVLSPFKLPDLEDAFCGAEGRSMQKILDGAVFVVRLPTAVYGIGARLAYTFLKLRFFNMMQRRRQEPTWNQDRAIFFVCDEYQEVISASKDGLSDLNFWSMSRDAGCVGIISAQGYSSFYAAIGDEKMANAVLQISGKRFASLRKMRQR